MAWISRRFCYQIVTQICHDEVDLACNRCNPYLIHKPLWIDTGAIMEELNGLALLVAITCPPLAAFSAYWAGFNKGKREGWVAGRSLMRIPMDTSK